MEPQKWNNAEMKQENGKCIQNTFFKGHENNCHRCGMKGHWSSTYCMPKHLDDLYQASMKEKGKCIEMKFIDGNRLNLTYYDVDFFGGSSERMNYLRMMKTLLLNYKIKYNIILLLHLFLLILFIIFILIVSKIHVLFILR